MLKEQRTHDLNSEESGFTLIELISVVILLAVVSGFFISKFNLSTSWGSDTAIRELSNRIEFLMQDSSSRKVNYEIEFFENGTGYRVWQIAKKEINQPTQVDLLKNLRSKKGQKQQEEKNARNAQKNLNEEFKKDSQIDRLPLNIQFYAQVFDDQGEDQRRIAPLEYPSLVEGIEFPSSMRLKGIKSGDTTRSSSDNKTILLNQNIADAGYELNLDSNGENIYILVRPFEKKVSVRYGNDG